VKIDNDGYLVVRCRGLCAREHGSDRNSSRPVFVELQEDQVVVHDRLDIFRTVFPSAEYRHHHLLVPALQLGSRGSDSGRRISLHDRHKSGRDNRANQHRQSLHEVTA
jgi:hypothetical protein